MKKINLNESKEKLFEVFEKLNSVVITESTSYLINNGMVKRALTAANLMVYKDEISDFDIAEAIAVYVHDYNDNNNVINQFKGLLKLSRFNPSPMFSYKYEDLSELSKMVYDAIVSFYEKNNLNEITPKMASVAIHRNIGGDERTKQISKDAIISLFSKYVGRDIPFYLKVSADDKPTKYQLIETTLNQNNRNYADKSLYDGGNYELRLHFYNPTGENSDSPYHENKQNFIAAYNIASDEFDDLTKAYYYNQYAVNLFLFAAMTIRKAFFTAFPVRTADYKEIDTVATERKMKTRLNKQSFRMFSFDSNNLENRTTDKPEPTEYFEEQKTNVEELNTSTYSDLMNKTSEYPWEYFFSKNPDKESNRKELGNQHGRINALARDRFVNEFYKEFPKNTISINTNNGQYIFIGIKFEANYTRYDVFFEEAVNLGSVVSNKLWISPSGGKFYINANRNNIEISDPESIKTVLNLLKYNKEQQKANMSEDITNNIDSYFDDVINNLYKLDSGDKVISIVKSKQKYFDFINRNFNNGFDANRTASAIRDHWYGV